MKTRLLLTLILAGSFGLIPQAVADNEFCNIQENLKIQEELIKDDVVLIEFLKVFPSAELTRVNFVQRSNPEQTTMTWTAGVYSLDIHIWGFDTDNPSDCFVPGGYRLNAPHLPEMTGNDYHKDPKIVLEQIEELEPKYVKGGPAPMSEEPEPIPHMFSEVDKKRYCEYAVERELPTPWKYNCYAHPAQNPQREMDFGNPLLGSPILGYDLMDCNESDNAHACFDDSFDSCTPAKIQQSRPSVEGDSVYTGAYITDDCKIHVVFDNREDRWSSLADRKITESVCSAIDFKEKQMMISNCDDGTEFEFQNNNISCAAGDKLVDGVCIVSNPQPVYGLDCKVLHIWNYAIEDCNLMTNSINFVFSLLLPVCIVIVASILIVLKYKKRF